MQAIIGLGSNVGNREAHLLDAARALESVPGVVPLALSKAYVTAPVGPPQPDYLNAALRLETTWPAEALLAALHGVEAALGRHRTGPRWGPRVIDLDLLLFEDLIVDERPMLPHPRLTERPFALIPLLEIAPEATDPTSGQRLRDIADALGDDGVAIAGPLPGATPRIDVDHTADRAFTVSGATLSALTETALQALAEVMFDRSRIVERERREIEVDGDDPEERLVALLGELPFLLDVEGFVVKRVHLLHLDDDGARAALFGETLHDDDQVLANVKAVTHHGAVLERNARGERWRSTVVVDV